MLKRKGYSTSSTMRKVYSNGSLHQRAVPKEKLKAFHEDLEGDKHGYSVTLIRCGAGSFIQSS